MKTELLVVNGNEVKFEIVENEKVMISSRDMAEHFGKEHNDVLKVIKREVFEEDFTERKISSVDYIDVKGEKRPMIIF